jgi:sporulation protein YlmC with PRC-barrel domain
MKLVGLLAAATLPVLSLAAIAQTTPAPTTPTTPSATTPSTMPSTTMNNNSGAATTPQWYNSHQGEWRSSKLIGTAVKNNAGETIGDINDVLLSKDGQARAVVIGVGGFLGVGEREVAVDFKSLQVNQDSGGTNVVMLNATKDALKNAPVWQWSRS